MVILVTGSAGHLGEALMRTFRERGQAARGLDIKPSACTDIVASIADRGALRQALGGASAVIHSATLHKPHIVTHSHDAFIQTNVAGTLALLEEAAAAGVVSFIYTSTTSAFGSALSPPMDAPAAWVTENITPVPKNIYGVTKVAAENLCEMFARRRKIPSVIVLRTSRFFLEADDDPILRASYSTDNLHANELLYRRVDIEDVVGAHVAALAKGVHMRFGRYIVSAATPFTDAETAELRVDLPAVIRRRFPEYERLYQAAGWSMLPSIDRVYASHSAMRDLEWSPRYGFQHVLDALAAGTSFRSPLALAVGVKGYHDQRFSGEPYPVEA